MSHFAAVGCHDMTALDNSSAIIQILEIRIFSNFCTREYFISCSFSLAYLVAFSQGDSSQNARTPHIQIFLLR